MSPAARRLGPQLRLGTPHIDPDNLNHKPHQRPKLFGGKAAPRCGWAYLSLLTCRVTTLGGAAAMNALTGPASSLAGSATSPARVTARQPPAEAARFWAASHSFRGTVATKHGENLTLALDELQQLRIEAVR